MTVRFCPQCGTKTAPPAHFCAGCGEALPGSGKSAGEQGKKSPPTSWRSLTPGLLVLSLYLVIGIGLWVFVLRSQPFPAVTAANSAGQASTGGSTLPPNHPPTSLPDEAKKRIAELVSQANAAPQDVNTWKMLADVQFRASQIDASYRSAALDSFRHVLELAPNDLDALRGVGNVYYELDEHTQAIEQYQKYLAVKPDDVNVRTDLGTMYLYSGEADRAIAEYQNVLAKQPEFFQAHFNLGIAYQEKGEREKARAALDRAKSLTTDANVRARIEQVAARLADDAAPAVATAPTDPARSPFQQAVEKLFRSHEIMGPRIARIEWSAPTAARVFFQNFPMAAMPAEVRERFLGKLRTQVAEATKTNSVGSPATIELVDMDTQQVMETISTVQS